MVKKKISVIIPVHNEEKNIIACLKSIDRQNYPAEQMEVLIVDGMSTDRTRVLIEEYRVHMQCPVEIINNEKKIVPVAMNIGIKRAKGDIIVRLDAHSEYEDSYIEKCIQTIERTDADNVGGLALTKGEGRLGEAFAQVLSSRFGVGNSGFRTKAKSGYADTVPFGTYKKETFQTFGMYNEKLVRNQDYELNYRIRKAGGKIYMNSDIVLEYHCKNTWESIIKQSCSNGKWNVITMKLCPGSMGIRHFIPLLFVLSLIIMPVLVNMFPVLNFIFYLELGLYALMVFLFACINNEKRYQNHFIYKLVLFPLFHVSYGAGSVLGLFTRIN